MIRKMKVKTKCKLKPFTFQIQQTNFKVSWYSRLIKGHIDSHTFIVNTEIGVAILEGNLPFIKFNMPY